MVKILGEKTGAYEVVENQPVMSTAMWLVPGAVGLTRRIDILPPSPGRMMAVFGSTDPAKKLTTDVVPSGAPVP